MKHFILALTFWGIATFSTAQIKYDGVFGKGLSFETNDGSFGVKFGTRIQPRWDFIVDLEQNTYTDRMTVKRARLKFDGFL